MSDIQAFIICRKTTDTKPTPDSIVSKCCICGREVWITEHSIVDCKPRGKVLCNPCGLRLAQLLKVEKDSGREVMLEETPYAKKEIEEGNLYGRLIRALLKG